MDEPVHHSWDLRPDDELPHVPTGAQSLLPWKDTWALALRDPDTGVIVMAHFTVSPGPGGGSVCRTSYVVRHLGVERVGKATGELRRDGDRFGTDLVTLDVLDGSWNGSKRVIARATDTDVAFEVRMRGMNDAAELGTLCPGALPRTSENCLFHVEQWQRFDGWVQIEGGPRIEVSGEGYRDRSWGWRSTASTFRLGWHAALGRTGETTYGFLNWPHPDHTEGDPVPVGAWISSPDGVVAATAGSYRRDSTGRPAWLWLDSPRGREVDVAMTGLHADVMVPFHDLADDQPIGIRALDTFATTRDPLGTGGAFIQDEGHAVLADVFSNADFRHRDLADQVR